ncbi:MAG: PhnD/SsuA/transferrin family substrate-binding protein, partial [Burkholderiales bacterium]
LERFKARFPDKVNDVRIIWKSPLIPNDPLVWREDLPADVKAKIGDFVLSYGADAREKENLKKITTAGFKASDNRQLVPIRQLELYKDKLKIESDDKLEPSAKQAKIEEINRKLAELETQLVSK